MANKYDTVGNMIANSLVQGGQPPVCFAKSVAEYLEYDKIKCDPSLNDISDLSVRNKLQQVCSLKCFIEATVSRCIMVRTCMSFFYTLASEVLCWQNA